MSALVSGVIPTVRPQALPAFGQYLRSELLANLPASVDYYTDAAVPLLQAYGNVSWQVCVLDAGYHIMNTMQVASGMTPYIVSDAEVVADYVAAGGYVIGNKATDNGTNAFEVFSYWRTHGMPGGSKLVAWVRLDPANIDEVKAAVWLFGGAYISAVLPDGWWGSRWNDWLTYDADNAQGRFYHAVGVHGYDATRFIVSSYGHRAYLPFDVFTRFFGTRGQATFPECYALIFDCVFTRNIAGMGGFGLDEMLGDFELLYGQHVRRQNRRGHGWRERRGSL